MPGKQLIRVNSARKSFLFLPQRPRQAGERYYVCSHHSPCPNVNNSKENNTDFYTALEFIIANHMLYKKRNLTVIFSEN